MKNKRIFLAIILTSIILPLANSNAMMNGYYNYNTNNINIMKTTYIDKEDYEKDFKMLERIHKHITTEKFTKINEDNLDIKTYLKEEIITIGSIFTPITYDIVTLSNNETSEANNPIDYAIKQIINKMKNYKIDFMTQFINMELNQPIFFETMKTYNYNIYETLVKLYQYFQILTIYRQLNEETRGNKYKGLSLVDRLGIKN